jgi:RsiW-degrading membrane proteinase PrsW (M82 family)
LVVLIVGLASYVLVQRTLVDTENPNFIPSMILLGAAVLPLTFTTFAAARRGGWEVPLSVLALAALMGGVIGTVVAAWLEYQTLVRLGLLPTVAVGLIEEAAKLLAPLVLLLMMLRRSQLDLADGLVIGIAAGMGFAVLETMGYAFVTLIASGGNIGAVEQTLFLRGLLSPAAHMAWTGLAAGALWRLAAAPSVRTVVRFVATFIAVAGLHAAWDSRSGLVWYGVLGLVSLGWLLWELHRSRTLRVLPDRRAVAPRRRPGLA